VQEGGGYVEVMGPRFDEAIEAIQLAWEEWKNGPMTEPEDIPQAKQDILDYIVSLLK
jgi:predicted RNase H-like HicB family nuclease